MTSSFEHPAPSPAGSCSQPTYRAHSMEDLLNALPAAMGFVPAESLIGVCVAGPNQRFGFTVRVDLPDDAGDRPIVAEQVAGHVRNHCTDGVILIGLSADPERAEDMVHEVAERLSGVPVRLRLWANEDRYWTDEPASSPRGEPYVLSAEHPARVEAVLAGQVVVADRAELVRDIEPVTGPRRVWLDAAVEQLIGDLLDRRRPGWESDHEAQMAGLLAAGDHDDGALLRLGVLALRVPGRDAAWQRITPVKARERYALWCSVARLLGAPHAVPALALAGYAAWLSGDGVRAMNALERALRIDPGCTLADLLWRLVSAGVDPRTCAELSPRGD